MFKHPANVCMTYWSHFKFSMYLSKEFAKASGGAFFHAIHPDILVTHSTDTINKLQEDMKKIGCRKIDLNDSHENISK